MTRELVVMGASWGGLGATATVLGRLPSGFTAAVALAQHRAPGSTGLLATLLAARCRLPVTEADDKEPIAGGRIYVAPSDYHLLVERGRFALSTEEPIRFSRPSIDALFESAAQAYGSRVAAVVLTGANADGARGSRAVADRGGVVLVQYPDEAERPEMPQAAADAVPEATVLPVGEIADALVDLCAEVAA